MGVRFIVRFQPMHVAIPRTDQRLKPHGWRKPYPRCSDKLPGRPPKNRRPPRPLVMSKRGMIILFIIMVFAIIGLIFFIAKLPGFLLCWLMYAGQCG